MVTGRLRHGQPHTARRSSPPALIGVRQAAAALCGRLACQSAGSHSRGRRKVPCDAGGGGAAATEGRRGTWLHLQPAQLGTKAGQAPAPVGAAPLSRGLGSAGGESAGAPPGPGVARGAWQRHLVAGPGAAPPRQRRTAGPAGRARERGRGAPNARRRVPPYCGELEKPGAAGEGSSSQIRSVG